MICSMGLLGSLTGSSVVEPSLLRDRRKGLRRCLCNDRPCLLSDAIRPRRGRCSSLPRRCHRETPSLFRQDAAAPDELNREEGDEEFDTEDVRLGDGRSELQSLPSNGARLETRSDGDEKEEQDMAMEKDFHFQIDDASALQRPQKSDEEGDQSFSSLLRGKNLSGRYKLVLATSVAFMICNMDKIPGGYASSLFGGRRILPLGVGLWSAATAALPTVAGSLPALYISRSLVGLGEGVAPSAATDIVARIIDPSERSRAISFIFAGLHVGSLVGLLLAPSLIDLWGWPSVFFLFGAVGILWTIWWEDMLKHLSKEDVLLTQQLSHSGKRSTDVLREDDGQGADSLGYSTSCTRNTPSIDDSIADDKNAVDSISAFGSAANDGHGTSAAASSDSGDRAGATSSLKLDENGSDVPWRGFIRNRPLQALAYTHFCNNWFHYTMLAWLPTFFTDTLSLNLSSAARVSLLPPIAAIAVSMIAGPLADELISRGVAVARVRKFAQCGAFLGPALCLMAESWIHDDSDSAGVIALVTISLGLASFSLAGLYCNHADLSPRYAPILLGLTNTCGAIPGVIGVAITGWLYEQTASWNTALFAPSIFFFVTGTAVFSIYGRAERQDFDSEYYNRPFQVELSLQKIARISDANAKEE